MTSNVEIQTFLTEKFCLLAPHKQMSFLTISNENSFFFFFKTQGTRLGTNKDLEQALRQT